jgi:hypothetical protein
MKFVEETAEAAKNKASDPICICVLNNETVTRKITEGKRMTAGLHGCAEGHHVGQFAFDILKQTIYKRNKDKLE